MAKIFQKEITTEDSRRTAQIHVLANRLHWIVDLYEDHQLAQSMTAKDQTTAEHIANEWVTPKIKDEEPQD